MGGNLERQWPAADLDGSEILLAPEIADLLASRKPEEGEVVVRKLRRLASEIAEAHSDGAVLQDLAVHAHIADRIHALGLLAERVLVEGDHLVVGEEAQGEGVELLHVAADQERRREEAPEAEVQVLLV